MRLTNLLLPILLSTSLLACVTDSVCDQAAAHIEECLGQPATPTATCNSDLAEAALEQSCEELQGAQEEGKADFFDWLCSSFGIACKADVPPYDPCAESECGDFCTICDPADPNCFETQTIKQCNAEGSCEARVPVCEAYDSCADKVCGDTCTICDPNDTGCFETSIIKQCNNEGSCEASVPTCELITCGGFLNLGCPDSAPACIDDPNDGCDPQNGGADCSGVCQLIECGGFLNLGCPDAAPTCIDNPQDSCDPQNGGSDCSGVCV